MTYDKALALSTMSVYKMASILVDALDSDYKIERDKILNKISEYNKEIQKLELELSQKKDDAIKKWIPVAERKKNEVEDYLCKCLDAEMYTRQKRS